MRSAIKNIITFLLSAGYFTLFSGLIIAQETVFTASAPSEVALGQGFNYTISGNENINASAITLPEHDDISHISGPSTFVSTQSSIVNGKIQKTTNVSFTYVFIANKEGKLNIPPAIIKSGKHSYSTNAVEVTVIAGPTTRRSDADISKSPESGIQTDTPDEKYFIRLLPSKRTVWLGEEILVSAKIYTVEGLRFSEIKYPELEGFWKQEIDPDQQAERESINNKQYISQVFKRDLLIPQKTGTIKINPVDVTVLVQQRVKTQRRSPFGDLFNDPFFDDSFFDSYQNVPVKLKSNQLTIEVKPLPLNAPAGFNGAVGSFSVNLSVGKETARVNEAITVTLKIKGKGNLALLKAPKIDFPPDIEIFTPKTSKNITHSMNGSNGSVSFEYIAIPRHPGIFRIPQLNFSYFDPLKGTYQSLKTDELNITVEKSDLSDQAEIMGMQQGIGGILKEEVTSLNTDILFIKTNMPVFRIYGKIYSDNLLFRLVFPAGILFFIVLLLIQRERVKRNRDLAYTRTRRARKVAVNRLNRARKLLMSKDPGMYEEILKAIWGYVGDKLSVDQANLSRQSAREGLLEHQVPEEKINELLELIDDCEMARYAGGISIDPENVYKRSEEILYRIESLIN